MKRVLLVEDNEDNTFLFRFILRKRGYEVIEARTGIESVRLAILEKPDLILMDIQLPDISGLEATRRIRGSDAGGEVIIIALTSYAMASDRERALAAGCNGYISKPINVETFVADIEQHLQVGSGR